jgi:hypothetical protein
MANTIVKRITVGTPLAVGIPSLGTLKALDDVVTTNLAAASPYIIYNESNDNFVFTSITQDIRRSISVLNVSGDGTILYDSALGQIQYYGPSASEVRAHLTSGTGLTYDSDDGRYSITATGISSGVYGNDSNFPILTLNTEGQVTAVSTVQLNTSNITEGSNLFYLTSRVESDLGSVGVSIVPDSDEAYDLGSPTKKFRALYLAGQTIYLGGLTLSDSSSVFVVKDSSGAVASFDISGNTTDDVAEGSSNLYYTTNRADSDARHALFGVNGVYYDPGNGEIRLDSNQRGTIGALTVLENAVIVGNLEVRGTTTTINSTDLSINDINITLADSAADSASADGAGITVAYVNAQLYWDYATNKWNLNRGLVAPSFAGDGTLITNVLTNYTTTDLAEGNNLYYLTSRFDSDLGARTTDDLAEGSNLYYTQARFDSAFGVKTTTNLTEGDNLYYTQARVDSAFDARLATKSTTDLLEGNRLYYTTARADSDFDVRLTTKSTTDLTEGDNLYYLTARADSDFDIRLATKTTTNVAEGDNLYYLTSRFDSDFGSATSIAAVRSYLSAAGDISYDSSTGVFSIDVEDIYSFENFDSDFRTRLLTTTTDSIGEGGNLYYTVQRVRDVLSVIDAGGDGSFSYDSSLGQFTYTGPSASEVRAHFSASGDITYNESTGTFSIDVEQIYTKANFDSDLSISSTSNLPEGNRLYYTTARADSDARYAISVTDAGGDGSLSYDPATGVVTYTGPSASEVRSHLVAGTGVGYDSSTGVISIGQAVETTSNVTFESVTNTTGTTNTNVTQTLVTSDATTAVNATAHNSDFCSVEYVVQCKDSGAGESQITKILATYDTSTVAYTEYGVVHTGDSDLGSFSVGADGTNISLFFTRRLGRGTIAVKPTKTVIR